MILNPIHLLELLLLKYNSYFRFFLVFIQCTNSQFTIDTINNTVGIFYHEKSDLKVSNNEWALLVYKDLGPVREALEHNDKILYSLSEMLDQDTPRINSFKPQIQTQLSLLRQISDQLNLKYREAFDDTNRHFKRGILNGLGSIFKSITGNLDAGDGEYYTECINKVTKDEYEHENLMKHQISVTTSVIKNFNATIQKLQIDEQTFDKDLVEIKRTIYDLSDACGFFES